MPILHLRAGLWLLMCGVVLVLSVVALYPFRLDPPRYRYNALERLDDGTLRFVEPSMARTPEAPAWLPRAIRESALTVDLEVRTAKASQTGPARILTLSESPVRADFTVAHEDDGLLVRVLRPGSEPWGGPGFEIPGVFHSSRWRSIRVRLDAAGISILVDGDEMLTRPLPAAFMEQWDSNFRLALGNDVRGERQWLGELRRARITVGATSFDLLKGGNLEGPDGWWEVPERIRGSLRQAGWQLLGVLLHFASFIPFGVLAWTLCRGRSRRRDAVWLGVTLAIALQIGKVFIEGRHLEAIDALAQVAGSWLGVVIAERLGSGPPSGLARYLTES